MFGPSESAYTFLTKDLKRKNCRIKGWEKNWSSRMLEKN
jgi:hypothetical protein